MRCGHLAVLHLHAGCRRRCPPAAHPPRRLQLEEAQGGEDPEARARLDRLRKQLAALEEAQERAAHHDAVIAHHPPAADASGASGSGADIGVDISAALGDTTAMLQQMDGCVGKLVLLLTLASELRQPAGREGCWWLAVGYCCSASRRSAGSIAGKTPLLLLCRTWNTCRLARRLSGLEHKLEELDDDTKVVLQQTAGGWLAGALAGAEDEVGGIDAAIVEEDGEAQEEQAAAAGDAAVGQQGGSSGV